MLGLCAPKLRNGITSSLLAATFVAASHRSLEAKKVKMIPNGDPASVVDVVESVDVTETVVLVVEGDVVLVVEVDVKVLEDRVDVVVVVVAVAACLCHGCTRAQGKW